MLHMSTNNHATAATQSNKEPQLVGMRTGLELVFPDPKTRPSIRAFNSWKQKGYFPSVRIGRRVFVDPVMVRKALDARFTINAQ